MSKQIWSALYAQDVLYQIPEESPGLATVLPKASQSPEAPIPQVAVPNRAAKSYPTCTKPWLILGLDPQRERSLLEKIMSAPPLSQSFEALDILDLDALPEDWMAWLKAQPSVKKVLLLGKVYQKSWETAQPITWEGKQVFQFPFTLAGLGPEDQDRKRLLWNGLKSMA